MDRIRKRRLELKLSQATLAEKSGVSQPFISRLERGATDVSRTNMSAIAAVLGLSPVELTDPTSPLGRLFRAVDRIDPSKHGAVADILERLADSFEKEPPGAK